MCEVYLVELKKHFFLKVIYSSTVKILNIRRMFWLPVLKVQIFQLLYAFLLICPIGVSFTHLKPQEKMYDFKGKLLYCQKVWS